MSTAGPKRLRQLLDAVLAVGSGLDLAEMLRRVTEVACDLVDAQYGALGVLDESGSRLAQFITVGMDYDTRAAIGELPDGHGILGLLIVDAEPLRLPDLHEHPDRYGFPPNHPEMRSFLGVPIRIRDQVFGNLYLTEKTSGEVFTDIDEELVVGLAAAAGVAIENARLHARVAELATSEDRDRIARDLHDTVIQRIFATGLSLQGTAPLVTRDPAGAAQRIEAAVDDLDETVKQIRSAIFALATTSTTTTGLRDRVLALCRESAGPLGFDPRVHFDGPVDAAVTDELGADLLATLRESLSNVARHARASRVDVSIILDEEHLTVEVTDDGAGVAPEPGGAGRGLANMSARASHHQGTFEHRPGPGVGTTIVWRVPRP